MGLLTTTAKAARKLVDEWDEAAWLAENPEPPGTKRSNPEKKKWLEKRQYYRNRQKKLDQVKARYEANAEEIKATERARYQANREKLLEGKREYYKNNKGKVLANVSKRKAAQLERTPDYSNDEAVQRIYEQAGLLSESTGIPYEVDHVIPLQGENVSGLHVPGNLMITPRDLNRSKHANFTPGDDPMRFNDVARQNIAEANEMGLFSFLSRNADKAGLAGVAGVLAAGQSEDADAGFVTRGGKTFLEAWHGSPHKFDKFSMDQIGTGEGAQAYGHGLYFADSGDVARGYQEELAGFEELFTLDGKPYSYPDNMPVELDPDAYHLAVQNAGRYGKDGAMEKAELMSANGYSDEWIESYKKYVGEVGERAGYSKAPKGHLYRTEIDVTPESLLDWDKPLSEQPQAVQDSLQFFEFDSNNPSGREMYHAITNQKRDYQLARIESINREMDKMNAIMKADESGYRQFKTDAGRDAAQRYDELMAERALLNKETTAQASQSAATNELDAFGIKGIKYLDGDSRAVGNGTSNYVIFDDSLINIAERGNASVPMLATTAAGSAAAAGFAPWPEYKDPNAPLPVPSFGEAMGGVLDVLGMPMTGLQGIGRGLYGLATGEDLATAGANAANIMGSEYKDGGLLMTPGMDSEKGATALESWVTEKTGDPSLGWMAKMGLIFGGI